MVWPSKQNEADGHHQSPSLCQSCLESELQMPKQDCSGSRGWCEILDELDNWIFSCKISSVTSMQANRFSAYFPKVVNCEQAEYLAERFNRSQIKASGRPHLSEYFNLRSVRRWSKLAISHPQKQRRHSVIKHHKFSTGKSQDSSTRSSTYFISSQLKGQQIIAPKK